MIIFPISGLLFKTQCNHKLLCLVQQAGHCTSMTLNHDRLYWSINNMRHGGRKTIHYKYLSSFVDFVLIPSFMNKHGSGLSILENRRVHGETRGQGQQWLLQSTAAHRAALRTHGRRVCYWTWRATMGAEGRQIHWPDMICSEAVVSRYTCKYKLSKHSDVPTVTCSTVLDLPLLCRKLASVISCLAG